MRLQSPNDTREDVIHILSDSEEGEEGNYHLA